MRLNHGVRYNRPKTSSLSDTVATNVCTRLSAGVAMGTQSLQRNLRIKSSCNKIRTKIQNVNPNKTTGSTENIRYPEFLSMVESFGGYPPTSADHVVFSQLYLSRRFKR